ncbi:MAG: amino acid adenylation domain-containing protein [Planctomycetaceae bacterium]
MPELIHEWVTQQSQIRPDHTAIVWQDERHSYRELDQVSNRLAELLRESGCHKGDRVAFCIPKSPLAIISMLGIMKADAVYVPIDAECPASRVAKVIDSCRPSWILAEPNSTAMLDEVFRIQNLEHSMRVGSMSETPMQGDQFGSEFCLSDLASFTAEPLSYQNRSHDAAHILFTSGSTGVPKGVIITHAMVIAFVEWALKYFDIDDTDRVSGHSPLHFDLSTFDTYGAFAAGAELHPVPPELNLLPHKLSEFIRKRELTQWFSVPSILNYQAKFDAVAQNDFPHLRRLMWCGEVLPTPTLMYFMQRLPAVPFTNLYGPTEATIASSYYTVPECPTSDTAVIPIGTACTGEELLVLDDRRQAVAAGTTGELYIQGVGLSPGYWQDEERTRAVFVQHPQTGATIYRTGDLARVDSEGLVEFIGRTDTQIKSRGHRIELGEIETALHTLDFLGESAVVAIETGGFENTAICCAYVAAADGDVSIPHIRRSLTQSLPRYMLPQFWLSFEQLPKNANGKIHRPRLQELFEAQRAERVQTSTGQTSSPANNTQTAVPTNTPQ